MRGIGDIAVEHDGAAGLNPPRAGDDASSVDLPTPSGPIRPTMQPLGTAALEPRRAR